MSSQKTKRSSWYSRFQSTPKPTFTCYRLKIVCKTCRFAERTCGIQAEYNQYYSVHGYFRAFDCELDEVPKGAKFVDQPQSLGHRTLEPDLCNFSREVEEVREILNGTIGDLCWRVEPLLPINAGKLSRALLGVEERKKERSQKTVWDFK